MHLSLKFSQIQFIFTGSNFNLGYSNNLPTLMNQQINFENYLNKVRYPLNFFSTPTRREKKTVLKIPRKVHQLKNES